MRNSISRLRSATLFTIVAALAGFAAVLVPAAAQADWVRDDQWQLGALNAAAAWQHTTGTGLVVAVLDSGVDANHPDLAGQVLPGLDLVDGSTDGRVDPVGHGTTVAGLIAGRRDEAGVVGMAPDAKILPVRVLDDQNRYEDASLVARGVRWAVDRGARVVNLSLGGLADSDILSSALAYAAEHDVVVVACTGNLAQSGGEAQVWYPAREPGVVAVAGLGAGSPGAPGRPGGPAGATAPGAAGAGWPDRPTRAADPKELWSGTLTGPQTVLTAPAVNLLGARPGGYWQVQGTSFAAPLVAGAATLVRSRFPTLTAPNVINRLISTAEDLGPAGRDDRYGYGLVNPFAALTADVATVAGNPLLELPHDALDIGAKAAGGDGSTATDNGLGSAVEPPAAGTPTGGGPQPASDGHLAAAEPGRRHALAKGPSTTPLFALTALPVFAVLGFLWQRRRLAHRNLGRPRHGR